MIPKRADPCADIKAYLNVRANPCLKHSVRRNKNTTTVYSVTACYTEQCHNKFFFLCVSRENDKMSPTNIQIMRAYVCVRLCFIVNVN